MCALLSKAETKADELYQDDVVTEQPQEPSTSCNNDSTKRNSPANSETYQIQAAPSIQRAS